MNSSTNIVTTAEMAISRAKAGSIGIVNCYNTIEEQVDIIKTVKRNLSFIIENPYTVMYDQTVNDLLVLINKYNVDNYPVIGKNNFCCGIVGKNELNLHIISGKSNDTLIKDIMKERKYTEYVYSNQVSDRKSVISIISKLKTEILPILDCRANMQVKGLILIQNLAEYEINKNNYSFDKQGRLLVGAIVSTVADFYERSVALINAGCDIIYIEYINKIDQQIIEKLKELNENVVITVK